MRFPLLMHRRPVGRPRPLAFPILELEELEQASEPNVRLLAPGEGLPDDPQEAVDAEVIDLRNARKSAIAAPDAGVDAGAGVEVEVVEMNPGAALPAVRFERAVMALAWRAEVLASRVERVEQRIDGIADQCFESATQSDLIEVETRRARLSMEVARMGIELRGQMEQGLASLGHEMGALASAVSNAAIANAGSGNGHHENPGATHISALSRVTPMDELGAIRT